MIDKIYKYITVGYNKRAIPSVAIEVGSINPVEHFVKTKVISGKRETCGFWRGYGRFKIRDFEFESKIFSECEIEYINQVKDPEIPNGINIKSIDCMFCDNWSQHSSVNATLSNGIKVEIEGRRTKLYKRVWHCLEYQAYLQFPELFTDKI